MKKRLLLALREMFSFADSQINYHVGAAANVCPAPTSPAPASPLARWFDRLLESLNCEQCLSWGLLTPVLDPIAPALYDDLYRLVDVLVLSAWQRQLSPSQIACDAF